MQWPVRASYRLEARQALQINFPQADIRGVILERICNGQKTVPSLRMFIY